MGAHHDNHTNEKKPVAFTVPFILAVVTLTAILSLVSLGDPCCCDEKMCAADCKEKCENPHGAKHEENHGAAAADEHGATKAEEQKATDSKKEAGEEHKPEAGH